MPNSHRIATILLIAALAAFCALGDYFLKKASQENSPYASPSFWLGVIVYAMSAFGWVVALQWTKLATVGAVFSLVLIVILAIIGVFCFGERVSRAEQVGLVLACISILLLARFS